MASNGQNYKMGDDALTGNGKPIDLDIEGDNYNAETYDQGHGEEDVGQTDDVPKKPSQSGYYKEDNLQVWKDSPHSHYMTHQFQRIIPRVGDRSPLPLGTTGVEDTLTKPPGRSDEESQEGKSRRGRVTQRRQTQENIGMFRDRHYASTHPIRKDRKGPTTKLRVVCQKK
ncbi:hypothetical protein ACSBR2_009728 [Camellia fascicularis]